MRRELGTQANCGTCGSSLDIRMLADGGILTPSCDCSTGGTQPDDDDVDVDEEDLDDPWTPSEDDDE